MASNCSHRYSSRRRKEPGMKEEPYSRRLEMGMEIGQT